VEALNVMRKIAALPNIKPVRFNQDVEIDTEMDTVQAS
jgi:hypothetical protein